jgi:anaerobic ribonucleoside-triphosphate reductase activating protein
VTILLNKAHYPVTVLGPGRRVGLWLQGCTIRCFGCISRDTWPANPESAVEVGDLLEWIRELPADDIDGVTISGGEPFDQPGALVELLLGLHAWRVETGREIDILCYSGRGWEELQREFAIQLNLLDAMVAEPFISGLVTDLALRGSANQRLIPLSDLGRLRYSPEQMESELAAQRGQVQVDVDDESIWFIGIPAQGDMSRVREEAEAAGIRMRRQSWLT